MFKVNGKVTFGAGAPGMIEYWRIDDTESTVPFALAINQPFVMVSDRGLTQERSYQLARFLAEAMNSFKEQAPPDLQGLPGGKLGGTVLTPTRGTPSPGHIPGNPPPNPVEMPKLVEKDPLRFRSNDLGGHATPGAHATPEEVEIITKYLEKKEAEKNAVHSDPVSSDVAKSDAPSTLPDN